MNNTLIGGSGLFGTWLVLTTPQMDINQPPIHSEKAYGVPSNMNFLGRIRMM